MKNIRWPLFYKLLLTFVLCSTIPLVIISSLMYGFSVDFLNKTIYDQTYTSIETAHIEIDKKFNEYEAIIEQFLKNEFIVNALAEKDTDNSHSHSNEMYEIIYETLIEQKIKPIVHITDLVGNKIYSTSKMPETYKMELKDSWGIFRTISQNSDKITIYPQKINYNFGFESIISLGAKIKNNDGKHVGYIVIDVPREVIIEEIRAINSSLSLHVVMLDKNGYTLLDTKNNDMEGEFQRSMYLDEEKSAEHKPISHEIRKDSFLVVEYNDAFMGTITTVNVSSNIFQAVDHILKLILLIGAIVSIIISFIVSVFLARYISNPIKDLITIMGEVEEGKFDIKANTKNNDEIGDLSKYFNQMLDRLNNYMNTVIEKQQQLRTTEIKMLQAQINPHFIYNTLDVIKWSAKLGEQSEVVSIVTNLAKLLRNSIDCDEEFVTVQRSIEFINSYLAIQKIKYNNTFEIVNNIDSEILDYEIPRLILQPFIENAIVHGLGSNNCDDGFIKISGHIIKNALTFSIVDNGIGMTEDEISEIKNNPTDQHIGINNVDQRIKMYYGETYGVAIESKKLEGTKVVIKLPSSHAGGLI